MSGSNQILPYIWIGTIGKLLVNKNLLDRQEIIDELLKAKAIYPEDHLLVADIDNAIQTVKDW